jgi:hypothetical protein
MSCWSKLLLPSLALLALSACAGGPDRRSETTSRSGRPTVAARPPVNPGEATRACFNTLNNAGVRYSPLPDQEFGGGCNARGAVRLSDIGTPTTNLGPMTCPLAANFAAWVRYAVKPAARQTFGEDVVRVETFGTYSCRNIYGGRSGRLSQHAFANAVDVSAFILADGTRVSVLEGWNGDRNAREFLRLIHTSACRRFGTVLSPDYNAAHANHFHFDMSGQNYCR